MLALDLPEELRDDDERPREVPELDPLRELALRERLPEDPFRELALRDDDLPREPPAVFPLALRPLVLRPRALPPRALLDLLPVAVRERPRERFTVVRLPDVWLSPDSPNARASASSSPMPSSSYCSSSSSARSFSISGSVDFLRGINNSWFVLARLFAKDEPIEKERIKKVKE